MLQRVAIDGIQFPRLYIAETPRDVAIARQNGIPYVRWKWGQEKLIKQLLRPTIEKLFPGIDWDKVLGEKKHFKSKVVMVKGNQPVEPTTFAKEYDAEAMLEAQHQHDLERTGDIEVADIEHSRTTEIATSNRTILGGEEGSYELFEEEELNIEDYVGDLSSSVDIDALQKLGLLPKFVGDVTDCIKSNLSQSMRWTEGYTKKLGYPLGKFSCKQELPSLVIIDVSWSIPDGIAATMLTLADTLRSQCNAELIITSKRSGYYPIGAELPTPQTLREYYGRSNESVEYWRIIKDHIAGREFGHVISFGDYDNPGHIPPAEVDIANTKVHAIHHYHTGKHMRCYMADKWTGYAHWFDLACPEADQEFDTSWCSIIKREV